MVDSYVAYLRVSELPGVDLVAIWLRAASLSVLHGSGALREWERGTELDGVVFQIAAMFPFEGNRSRFLAAPVVLFPRRADFAPALCALKTSTIRLQTPRRSWSCHSPALAGNHSEGSVGRRDAPRARSMEQAPAPKSVL